MTRYESLPLFPLQLVLFPGQKLQLHIFEQRYRQLLNDCLAGEERFGVVLLEEGRMSEVGCTARIDRVLREYDDGRSDILVIGEQRFRVRSLSEERAYLTGESEPIAEPGKLVDQDLRHRVIAQHLKLTEYMGDRLRPTSYSGIESLSYYLAQRSGLSLRQKQQVLESPTEHSRLRFLAEHLRTLLSELGKAADEQERIRSDGWLGAPPSA